MSWRRRTGAQRSAAAPASSAGRVKPRKAARNVSRSEAGRFANSTRRAILARLAQGAANVNELAEPFDLTLPAISKHLRGQDGRNEADRSDIANFTASDQVLEQLSESALAEIRQIRAALQRIEDGTFGNCVACGEAIAPKRLEALPWTQCCVACASEGKCT